MRDRACGRPHAPGGRPFATTIRVAVEATTSSSSPGFRPRFSTNARGIRTPRLLPHLETNMPPPGYPFRVGCHASIVLTDRTWKLKYTPDDGDLVEAFYVPALHDAARYDRLTGYFDAGAPRVGGPRRRGTGPQRRPHALGRRLHAGPGGDRRH